MTDSDDKADDDKENVEHSRAETSMSDSTFMPVSGSGREINKSAEVMADGVLDLSNSNLTNLDRNFQKEYSIVRELNVSGNLLETFGYMKLFPECEILDARNNLLKKFIADFNNNMKCLYLSGNQLNSASQFSRFENLVHLDLSQNELEDHFSLSLKTLKTLDLSRNKLKRLPDLSQCILLTQLDLSENNILDLQNLPKLICPLELIHFSISYNNITDLSQLSLLSPFKKLKYLNIAGNPCIDDLEQFDYRPYIFACCALLERLDDEEISDYVRTQGEFLCINREVKLLTPGNHEKLCTLMAAHFPANDDGPPTPAQKACQKALGERRDRKATTEVVVAAESDRTDNSVYSPCREWSGKMAGRTPIRDTPTRNRSLNLNLRTVSPPGKKNRSFTFRNGNIFETPEPAHPQALSFSRTNSTETIILSSRTELSIDGVTPSLPVVEHPAESRTASNHRSPSVADVSVILDQNEVLLRRVSELEAKVDALAVQNKTLTDTNTTLAELLETFRGDQERMWKTIQDSIPRPQNMTATFHSDNEEGLQTHIVKWELPIVSGYEIHVDGNPCGKVIGKNNSARITDLDPDKAHIVQIQTIGLGGVRGAMSKKLQINPK